MAVSKYLFNQCLWLGCIVFISVTIKSSSALGLFKAVSKNPDDIKFYYFPIFGVRREIKYNDVSALQAAGLKDGASTVLLIDGFYSNSSTPFYEKVGDELLSQKKRQNVIIVDYTRLSGQGVNVPGGINSVNHTVTGEYVAALLYQKVLSNVEPIGMRIADFLNYLKEQNLLSFSSVHIIGMSLGAHIAGATGAHVEEKYKGKVGRITGLDPAFTFFPFREITRIRRKNAVFVDIYHTNRGTLGETDEKTGHLNVYINDGANQPGCHWLDITGFPGYCSHTYAWKLFFTSFTKELNACPCYGYDCLCKSYCKVDKCAKPIPVLSKLSDTTLRGTYHLSIKDPLDV